MDDCLKVKPDHVDASQSVLQIKIWLIKQRYATKEEIIIRQYTLTFKMKLEISSINAYKRQVHVGIKLRFNSIFQHCPSLFFCHCQKRVTTL